MATFATGGCARSLQTRELVHKDRHRRRRNAGHDEFIDYEAKLFDTMDKRHSRSLGPQEFLGK